MRAEGKLPTNIVQTITLYNTTNVIEREKGIYFCPFLSPSLNKTVRQGYLDELELVCTTSNYYKDIAINQWSPEDRTLSIKGVIEDFRCNNENGYAFNYLIVKRISTYKEGDTISTVTNYYAFFIDSVTQNGIGTILLNVEPDHFTNVFYLHNTNLCNQYTADDNGFIDVFSPLIKNPYVERQHYNRVEPLELEEHFDEDYDEFYDSTMYDVVYEDDNGGTVEIISSLGLPDNASNVILNSTSISFEGEVIPANWSYLVSPTITNGNLVIALDIQTQNMQNEMYRLQMQVHAEYSYDTTTTSDTEVKEGNLDIFSKIEESFKYKRLYKDYKRFMNYGDPLTYEEEAQIKSYAERGIIPQQVPSALMTKLIKSACAFVHITLNKNILIRDYLINALGNYRHTGNKTLNLDLEFNVLDNVPDVQNGLITLVVPVFNPIYPYYENYIQGLYASIETKVNGKTLLDYREYHSIGGGGVSENLKLYGATSLLNVNEFLRSDCILSQYVLSAYLSKESSLIKSMTFSSGGITINAEIEEYTDSDIANLIVLPNMNGYDNEKQTAHINDITASTRESSIKIFNNEMAVYVPSATNIYGITEAIGNNELLITYCSDTYYDFPQSFEGFLAFIERTKPIEFELDLSEKPLEIDYLKNNFYDTVLTFNPYSFYSVSYLGHIETALNKINYYEDMTIKCELNVMATNVFKYGFYPSYVVDGKEVKYFSESLEQTTTNELTVINDATLSFLLQNKAQMKNQFAVNGINLGANLIGSGVDTATSYMTAGAMYKAIGEGMDNFVSAQKGVAGIRGVGNVASTITNGIASFITTGLQQKAKLADVGNQPDNVKQVGTDIILDTNNNELGLYLNHYKIDTVSYNSISKYLERYGYLVNIYDDLQINSRIGYNYIKLVNFDYSASLSIEQENAISEIFENGVTLLHNPDYLHEGHNYETFID